MKQSNLSAKVPEEELKYAKQDALEEQIKQLPSLYEWQYKDNREGKEHKSNRNFAGCYMGVGGVLIAFIMFEPSFKDGEIVILGFILTAVVFFLLMALILFFTDPKIQQDYRLTEVGIQCTERELVSPTKFKIFRTMLASITGISLIATAALGPHALVGVVVFGLVFMKLKAPKTTIENIFFHENGSILFYQKNCAEITIFPAPFAFTGRHLEDLLEFTYSKDIFAQNEDDILKLLALIQPTADKKKIRFFYIEKNDDLDSHPALDDESIPSEPFPSEVSRFNLMQENA